MGSTFGGLSTAYSGLMAARTGIDVTGQNIVNVTTDGYTRQRVTTTSIESPSRAGMFSAGVVPGQGVSVDAIARLGNLQLDGQVRAASSASGYQSTRASALSTLEASLNEPSTSGLGAQLNKFWSAWQALSNNPSEPAAGSVLLGQASTVAATIAAGYQAVDDQWSSTRQAVDGLAGQLNSAATQIAELNQRIRTAVQAGGSANELIDQRSRLTETVAGLAGGTVRENTDGTVDVLVGGNQLVSGTTARSVTVVGEYRMGSAATGVHLEWSHRPGDAIALDGGTIAGSLSVLAPASGSGTGGVLAEAAASYDALANQLAAQVNAVHATGNRADGTSGHAFFGQKPGVAAALGLLVLPTDVSGIASATPGSGALDGGVAGAIAQVGTGTGSPDRSWAAIVSGIGAAAKTEDDQATLTRLAATAAATRQQSSAGVSLDEENVNLMSYQHAYQGAARVMTAIDEMLDTLINGMGRVGR